MAKRVLILLMLCSLSAMGQLRVSANQRYLVNEQGKPFFWLGDTAWELFHRLNKEEADRYLTNRAQKGFTVIQAVALAELDGLNTPNPYGQKPLLNNNPTTPNPAYFEHVDYIIDKAASLGLYIGLLPTWGDKVYKDGWGTGPEVFTAENARTYGRWIGNRYRDRKNIIWINGGDRNPRNATDIAIWRALAEGIVEGVGGQDKAVMTFHPQPNSLEGAGSSEWFHQDQWLDFNFFQTGHCREIDIWDRIAVAYHKKPTKPVMNGEPIYEDHPVCFNAKQLGISSAYDVRKAAYHSLFSGAFGHTYGCHGIWQMWAPGRQPINSPTLYWYDALDLPGASQMQYVRKLMEARPMLDRVPDNALLVSTLHEHNKVLATRGEDYLMVYSSQGRSFELWGGRIQGDSLRVVWFDPRTGTSKESGSVTNKGVLKFSPPSSGYGQDWVLLLDNTSKNYPLP